MTIEVGSRTLGLCDLDEIVEGRSAQFCWRPQF